MNNYNTALRFMTWSSIYPMMVDTVLQDFMSKFNLKNRKAMWETYLHQWIKDDKSDEYIIGQFTKLNLLDTNEFDNIKRSYDDEYKRLDSMYFNQEIYFLTSLDSDYPVALKKQLELQLNPKSNLIQYIPNVFVYLGNRKLLESNDIKLAIVGTRKCKNIEKTKAAIRIIKNKYPYGICVTGLAVGVDSLGVHEFDRSIVFIGEQLFEFAKKRQQDDVRRTAKEKTFSKGLILSHKLPHEIMSQFDYRNSLLERNLFVVLISDQVHAIEYGIQSGTISAITYAIKHNKKIFSPKSLIDESVQKSKRFKKVIFY